MNLFSSFQFSCGAPMNAKLNDRSCLSVVQLTEKQHATSSRSEHDDSAIEDWSEVSEPPDRLGCQDSRGIRYLRGCIASLPRVEQRKVGKRSSVRNQLRDQSTWGQILAPVDQIRHELDCRDAALLIDASVRIDDLALHGESNRHKSSQLLPSGGLLS